jgi:hypothetical protein
MRLYEFDLDCGRMGRLQGLFICNPEILERFIGQRVLFVEMLGKHSEIEWEISTDEITEKPASDGDIETLIRVLKPKQAWGVEIYTVSGVNPLLHIEEEVYDAEGGETLNHVLVAIGAQGWWS